MCTAFVEAEEVNLLLYFSQLKYLIFYQVICKRNYTEMLELIIHCDSLVCPITT
jgi:hypothetical protein